MLKHIVHSHHGKLHTFDDFYRNDAKTIKTRSPSNDLVPTNSHSNIYSSPSPTSPSSPNSNPYTFYNVFSDFKSSNVTPDVVLEEDETKEDNETIPQESTNHSTPVFYLEDEHQNPSSTSPLSSSSPHWSSLILNRFRHPNHHHHHHHGIVKQTSVNESQMSSTKIRKNNLSDPSIHKHRFLKRSQTINNTNVLTDKKSSTEDFPELSLPSKTKHRSFVTLFQHQNKCSSTGTLHSDNIIHHSPRMKLTKQKSVLNNNDFHSPVNKTPVTHNILPKLASLFHRHHFSEHHKHRVGNLKARLHHRRNSPPLTQILTKFQCEVSNELIQEVQKSEEEEQYSDDLPFRRPVKPVVMKRVRTWHNTFDLRPVDQCLEY